MELENKRPLAVLREVENINGGVMKAKCGCDLPRNRRQIYNTKQAIKTKSETKSGLFPGLISDRRSYAQVMQVCMQRDIIQHGCFC